MQKLKIILFISFKYLLTFHAMRYSVRSKVEFAFHVVKDLFSFRKTRYKGLKKLEAEVYMLFVSANFYMILMGQKGSTKLQRRKALV